MKHFSSHPWSLSEEVIIDTLKTDKQSGLSDAEAAKRLSEVGENIFEEEKAPSRLGIFARQFKNPLVLVLLLAVGLTVVMAEWVDAAIILFAVLINTGLGYFQEYKAERAIADLRSYILERSRVVRNGKEMEIDSRLLVPGDIVHVLSGDRVTADARLLEVTNLTVDEAILTGESLPVNKSIEALTDGAMLAERTNMIFAGTVAMDGSAYAVVTGTGYDTEIGRLAKLVSETEAEKTPLQIAVRSLAWVIIGVITLLVAVIFTVGLLQGQELYDLLLICIAIIVGSVPEALPIGMTAVLAIGVERIARKKGIMRSLTAAETLGSTTVVITDKTGTLTEAKMELVGITPLEKLLSKSFSAEKIDQRYSVEQKHILQLALFNSDVVIEDDTLPPEEWVMSGALLEQNIVQSAAKHGMRITSKDRSLVSLSLPFSSRYKFSVTSVPDELLPEAFRDGGRTHVILGAPDILLAKSSMSKDSYLQAEAIIASLSEQGRRVLGVAVASFPDGSNLQPDDIKDIKFVGTLGFVDPIRKEVPEALRQIADSGVKVVMATGDLPGTALAIGRSLGWDIDRTAVLTGAELQQLSDAELLEMSSRLRVFARVTPADKVRIAQMYQQSGEVVAMTGDGVNDGPALKAANIGIALGSGSDVAKGIADLVLLDNNFSTIVSTIKEGKLMLVNIKKIFVYLMSNALDEVVLIGGSILAGAAMPLTAIQIIWVNLCTGSIPAIAYAFDRQPMTEYGRQSKTLFDSTVKFLTIGIGLATSFLLLILYFVLLQLPISLETAQSVVFVCFSSYILAVAFSFCNLQKPLYSYSLTENKLLLWGVLAGFILIGLTIYLPFFQSLFGVVPLAWLWLLFAVVWIAFNVALVEVAKWIAYTKFVK